MKEKSATHLCYCIMLAFGVVISIIGPLLTDISKEFSLSLSATGVFFTINYLGLLSFVFIGGILAERFGKKNLIAISLLGLSLSLFVFGISSNIMFAFIAIFFIGGFGSIIQSSVNSLIADLNSLNKDYYINAAQMFFCIGAVFGPVLVLIMMKMGNSWRFNYIVLAILIFVLFFAMIKLQICEKPGSEKLNLKDLKETLWDKRFLRICLCIALYAGTELGVWGWMSTFMKKELALSGSAAILIVSVFWMTMTIGRLICGRLMKYFNVRSIIISSSLISSLAVLLSGLIEGEVLILINVIVLGLSFSSIFPLLLSEGSSINPSSTAFAVMVGSSGIGIIVIPFIIGLLGDFAGMSIAMMSPGIFLVIIALLFVRCLPPLSLSLLGLGGKRHYGPDKCD